MLRSCWESLDVFRLNPRLTKGGGYRPLPDFSLSPQNQKESDLSHLGDLSDILRNHFNEKN